jgi:hypothetical protein
MPRLGDVISLVIAIAGEEANAEEVSHTQDVA